MNYYRSIEKEVVVNATLEQVWQTWTTRNGVETFFAPKANIDFKIGGMYEMLFDLKKPVGEQGSEGVKILSFLPNKMLSFEWNAPPEFGVLRYERTIVVLLFDEVGESKTRIHLSHIGWGKNIEHQRGVDFTHVIYNDHKRTFSRNIFVA